MGMDEAKRAEIYASLEHDVDKVAEQQKVTEGESELLDAAKRYDWDTVQAMLRANPEIVNAQPGGRWSALHQAAHWNDSKCKVKGWSASDAVRMLLSYGADVY